MSDPIINELQRIEEDQRQIIAQTKQQGESQIKEFESVIEKQEETIKNVKNEVSSSASIALKKEIEEYEKNVVMYINKSYNERQGRYQFFRAERKTASGQASSDLFRKTNDELEDDLKPTQETTGVHDIASLGVGTIIRNTFILTFSNVL